jgi:squalene synthase HpnC
MSTAADFGSGKGHKDENFPVASFVLKPQHRAPVMTFYRFARTADDVADHAEASPQRKLELLEAMRATLAGERDANPEALALRGALAERGLSPQHGLDLLTAFSQDATKTRYASWAELMDYCRYSASPVGRFVLDVHGESRELWGANDALCTALQVINHLQDCADDYRQIDRVYLPEDELAKAGARVDELGAARASPALLGVIRDMARRTGELLDRSRPFAAGIRDARLAYEVALIQRLAEDLTARLLRRDPLCDRVHHKPWEVAGLAVLAGLDLLSHRERKGPGPQDREGEGLRRRTPSSSQRAAPSPRSDRGRSLRQSIHWIDCIRVTERRVARRPSFSPREKES